MPRRVFGMTEHGSISHILTPFMHQAYCHSGLKINRMTSFYLVEPGVKDPLPDNLCKRCRKIMEREI